MALDATSLATLARAAAAAGDPVALSVGQVLTARIAAMGQENLARLMTAMGSLSATLDQPLPPGTRATFTVKDNGAVPTLALVKVLPSRADGEPAASASPESPPAGDGSAPTGTAPSRPAGTDQRAAAPATNAAPGAPSAPTRLLPPALAALPAPVAQAVLAAVAAASAGQDSPAPLLANLQALRSQGDLPPSVRLAASAVLATVWAPGSRPDPEGLARAVAQSGLFAEAHDGTLPDLKQTLTALRGVLARWSPADPIVPRPDATPVPKSATVGHPAAPEGAPSPDAPDRAAAVPGQPVSADGATRTADGGQAFLRALLIKAFGHDGAEGSTSLPRGGETAAAPRDGVTDPHAERTGARVFPAPGRLDLPRAAGAPAPLPPAQPSLSADAAPRDIKAVLSQQMDAALDRVTLSQVASLPAGSERADGPGWKPGQAVVLDLPMQLPGEMAAARLRIGRDEDEAPSGRDGAPGTSLGWMFEFALDSTLTGPVHARLRLGGSRLAVTLWAERGDMLDGLRAASAPLTAALREQAFEVEDVVVRAGAPRRPAPVAGGVLDARS